MKRLVAVVRGSVTSVVTITRREVPETRWSRIALQFGSLNSGLHCRPDEGNAAELEGRKPTGNSNRQRSAPFGDEEATPVALVGREVGRTVGVWVPELLIRLFIGYIYHCYFRHFAY
jgi:hypothetical protein